MNGPSLRCHLLSFLKDKIIWSFILKTKLRKKKKNKKKNADKEEMNSSEKTLGSPGKGESDKSQ